MTQISNGESSPLSPDVYAAKSSSIETDSDSSVQLNNEMMQNMEMNLLSDLQITLKGMFTTTAKITINKSDLPNNFIFI